MTYVLDVTERLASGIEQATLRFRQQMDPKGSELNTWTKEKKRM